MLPFLIDGVSGFVGMKQTNSNSVRGVCVMSQMKEALLTFLLMISPAFADNQNVYDFDPLNFKLE
jgi:hypothetical protein